MLSKPIIDRKFIPIRQKLPNRIAKRSRKVVDYDRHRHHLETLKVKGGKTGDPKKLTQAEEDYNQAKNAYLQLHSDLYEELPALYDSRISIYVSSFQSIFTAEGVFHRETGKIKTEMNDLLDVLAKETSAGAYSTRRPLSGISNVSSDGDSSPENCAKNDQTDGKTAKHDHTDENSENETSENDEGVNHGNDETEKPLSDNTSTEVEIKNDIPPPRPPPVAITEPIERPPSPNTAEAVQDAVEHEGKTESTDAVEDNTPAENESEATSEKGGTEKGVVEKVAEEKDVEEKDIEEKDIEEKDVEEKDVEEKDVEEKDVDDRGVEGKGVEEKAVEEKNSDIDLSRVLYKVEATHPYTGEDEDELTFEKGDIIQVVPYNESDDPDDGWLLGIVESTGVRGVFPENFTKKLEA
ncbi:myc box-dependent-interacting 1-like [Paramuricea clavata]|uniref:Myc box-dependent-interacting 1-like n=2 Tax=Paramuricea clavata TaxID=317549 RepID=A0A6S7GM32_PARCT|nr:myc box-dependent-interacting 1-like [Paramuricea clavata]